MKKIDKKNQGIVIYQAPNGAIELRGDFTKETVWATQTQIAKLFDTTPQNITLHLKNIYVENELKKVATCKEFLQVQKEGKRLIKRKSDFYNLDAIIAVGYRISSKKATEFRIWATKILREHIVQGYTINRKRIADNYDSFIKAVENVRLLLPAGETKIDTGSVLELVRAFADTWISLDAYDRGEFARGKTTKRKVVLAARDLEDGIAEFRAELVKKGEAGDLFAFARSEGGISGIVGSVMQTFGGKDLYPAIEDKAAHLLYFMVKNHPFADGNKRSGAFSFVWFLRRAGILDTARLTPSALTALTLLIAESNPKDKDKMIGLVTMLLRK